MYMLYTCVCYDITPLIFLAVVTIIQVFFVKTGGTVVKTRKIADWPMKNKNINFIHGDKVWTIHAFPRYRKAEIV